jgi:hypothetical protein
MANPAGESYDGALRLDFDRRLMLQFHLARLDQPQFDPQNEYADRA